ncbi:MAG: isoleucine--tRNA ligase [candidate division Zixibacteria bacterium]|nr:isoleucine--tRNA ligase [candidate division Zixibacteria bacterium]
MNERVLTKQTDTEQPKSPAGSPHGTIEEAVLKFWEEHKTFEQSVEQRQGAKTFVFFEGPPTANGKPGIHHVISRTIKDLACRYHTMKGYRVERKAGWDTHGLPVEIEVEKELGLNSKAAVLEYGVDKFNAKCRESVFKYKDEWDRLTRRIGYWLDLDNPYVTLTNEYIESVWWILAQFFKRGLLYEGHKIVPYCPRCETGLSSHEVSLGYETVKDPSITVTMPLKDDPDTAFLVWTTTPWTLISNTALAVGPDVDYIVAVKEGKRYILAEARANAVLGGEFEVAERFKGKDLVGTKYEPIFPFFADDPSEKIFSVLEADFVSTEDGTGIVHMAPAFGADDYEIGKQNNLPTLQPVMSNGQFDDRITPYAGQFVKDADKHITKDLKEAGRLFDAGQIEHSYPFCWRCDTPLLYYARRSWYVKTSQYREQLLNLNRQINWYPPEIGEKRFGEWLENNVDWALSRERFWGTPLPIWMCEQCNEATAVESVEDLQTRGSHVPEPLDLHKPYVDEVTLTCPKCSGTMKRVTEVIDVWFDSGSMPFAQWHYPFEDKDKFPARFPANFISEAVDQTRGWFYSLHAIASLLMGEPSYKNCLVMEFVVDKKGRKMSKSKGNVVDPWAVIASDGADSLRWYLLSVSQPWIPTKFDTKAVSEIRNRFFDTWRNTLAFYELYAGIDNIDVHDVLQRKASTSEFDRWMHSRLASVTERVDKAYGSYDLTSAVRIIADFTVDDVSNWYVRLNRRRFWGSETTDDKLDAFATLAQALLTIARLAAPAAPFFAEHVYQRLMGEQKGEFPDSVHLSDFPTVDAAAIDTELESHMDAAQRIVSLGRAARAKARQKVRQPLASVAIVLPGEWNANEISGMNELIKSELNVKAIDVLPSADGFVTLSVKPNFAELGRRLGPQVKELQTALSGWTTGEVDSYRRTQAATVDLNGTRVDLGPGDLIVDTTGPDGYFVESDGRLIVGIDARVTDELRTEGFARELVNRVQNQRKKMGLAVTDRIRLTVHCSPTLNDALSRHTDRIKNDTLAVNFTLRENTEQADVGETVDLNGEAATIIIETAAV